MAPPTGPSDQRSAATARSAPPTITIHSVVRRHCRGSRSMAYASAGPATTGESRPAPAATAPAVKRFDSGPVTSRIGSDARVPRPPVLDVSFLAAVLEFVGDRDAMDVFHALVAHLP